MSVPLPPPHPLSCCGGADLTTDPALVNYLSSSSGRTPAATADALSLLRVTAKDLQVEVTTTHTHT